MNETLWTPRPHANKSAPNYVIDQIRQSLLEKKILPGDKLPPESELVELFGVSRGSVRQAMKSLETLGVITIRPGDGTYVNTAISENNLNPLAFALLLSSPSGKVITDARYALERDIMELILEEETLAEAVVPLLKENIEYHKELMQSGAPSQVLAENDRCFHQILSHGCGNLILQTVYNYVLESFEAQLIYTTSRQPMDGLSMTIHDHEAILDAIISRDFAKAKSAIKNSVQNWLDLMTDAED